MTDPFALSARIDAQLERLLTLATRPSRTPRERRPPARSPWHGWIFSPTLQRQQQAQRQAAPRPSPIAKAVAQK